MSDISKQHKIFGEAVKRAVAIIPEQLAITKLVRQLSDEERALFQQTINQHPAMLEDLKDKQDKVMQKSLSSIGPNKKKKKVVKMDMGIDTLSG